MTEMTWRQMRIVSGKTWSTCHCTDQPKYARCRTCPWFAWGARRAERWRDTSELGQQLMREAAGS